MEIKNKRGKIILRTNEADLKGANLKGAILIGANLSEAKTKYCTVNFSPSEYEQAKQFIEGLK